MAKHAKSAWFYAARVRLNQNHLNIDGVKVNLSAGMNVSAEIKTGKRRVIEYFLSPLQEYASEGLRERWWGEISYCTAYLQ